MFPMKMKLLLCFFISLHVMLSDERLIVSGSNFSLSAYVGQDMTLNCSVDSHIPPEEVSWKKIDKHGNILVLLYQNNKIHPDSSDERYRDRVEFFSDEIHRGNFSLRLKRVRTEDKGLYMCQVFAGPLTANTTVELQQLGFSGFHVMVLILCVTACGSVLLIWWLILRSQNSVLCVQMCLVFCPNILMFFAFVFWGVSEGFLNETVTCCALFFLRPLMLLWSAPQDNDFPEKMRYVACYSFCLEFILFTSVVFSVLYKNVGNRLLHFSAFERSMITVLFGMMPVLCVIIIVYIVFTVAAATHPLKLNIMAFISFDILPPLQLILLFYAFGVARGTFLIAGVLPVIVIVARFNWNYICGREGLKCHPLVTRTVWFIFTLLMNVIIGSFYLMALENEEDIAGWACLIMFLQVLWAVINFRRSFNHWGVKINVAVYLFGSAGVVLINAVALMTKLIVKKVNGEHSLGDLRVTVFTSESLFAVCLLILQIYDVSGGFKQSETQLRRQIHGTEPIAQQNP
ncbi:uncharacterized protein LOC130561115 isoform X2 [Triplophysa rosa]|uniref:uncharacterized protein LOC130561115 isoform X2 n=1 Tax=Triplophysa rosa TaxID=992332 RepID=UPI002546345F|nr:uncharacterized protein LOC130561115 isoform X2 [Triplophysa rosa]